MGIELYWDDDTKSVMQCVIHESWTWDEMFNVTEEVKRAVEHINYKINIILDFSSEFNLSTETLFDMENLENTKRLLEMGEKRSGLIVVVGANALVHSIYKMLCAINELATTNVVFADNLWQARALLAESADGTAVVG
ncbi:MAG: hypothetical protein K8L99_03555 [Anaerolineae bacterium]|nr:hypothetical protein [Anaerolineae bacterium]